MGRWYVGSHMMGETIPKETNYVRLDKDKKDEWGIPLLKISVDYDDNDEKMIKDFFEQMTEMYTKAGFTDIKTTDANKRPDSIFMKWVEYEWERIQKHRC